MSKSKIIDQSLQSNIIQEREILSKIKNDFIINMKCSFQDFSNLFLVLQLMTGGDLRYHIYHYNKSFNEEMIKFVIVNILFCLQFIHQKGIIHRDIKPDNFVFDESGYLHLTDFGLASFYEDEKALSPEIIFDNDNNINYIENEMVGTIGYIAPEIILGLGKYTFSVDYYALGIICYELLFQCKPYIGTTRYQIGKEILEHEINYYINSDYSNNIINLIKNLLEINPEERLGTISGINSFKQNEYLKDFDWDSIQERTYPSPFIEVIDYLRRYNNNNDIYELFEIKNCNFSFKLDDETSLRLSKIEADPNYIYAFQGYSFIYYENEDFNDITSLIQNRTKKKKLRKANTVIKYVYRVKHNIQLPPIYPQLYRDAYKYKIQKYNKLLNKIGNKESEHKSSKEKEKKKHHHHKHHKKTDSHSSYDGRPLIINNYMPPKENYPYNYNQYYHSPFQSIQNNFILPEINPFLKGFNAMNKQNYENKKILLDKSKYSKYSSSEKYKKLYKNNKKEKDIVNKIPSNPTDNDNTKKNDNNKNINKSLSKNENNKDKNNKNQKDKNNIENKNTQNSKKLKSEESNKKSIKNEKSKDKKSKKNSKKSDKEKSSNEEDKNKKGLNTITGKSEENDSSTSKKRQSESKDNGEESEEKSEPSESREKKDKIDSSENEENNDDDEEEENDD